MQITGQVRRNYARIGAGCLKLLKSKAQVFEIPAELFEESDIHIHIPEGSIPKDGPSAGNHPATALSSLFLACQPVTKLR